MSYTDIYARDLLAAVVVPSPQALSVRRLFMALTSSDQCALARIETELRRSDPELAGMLATFTDLSQQGRGPAWDQVSPWRPRPSLVVGVMLIAIGICLFVACELVIGRVRRWLAIAGFVSRSDYPNGTVMSDLTTRSLWLSQRPYEPAPHLPET
jgi:hypothetical protein